MAMGSDMWAPAALEPTTVRHKYPQEQNCAQAMQRRTRDRNTKNITESGPSCQQHVLSEERSPHHLPFRGTQRNAPDSFPGTLLDVQALAGGSKASLPIFLQDWTTFHCDPPVTSLKHSMAASLTSPPSRIAHNCRIHERGYDRLTQNCSLPWLLHWAP